MCVELLGYSERGMVNALCYDIASGRDFDRVETFLSWFDFSHLGERDRPCFSDIRSARLIVEQSFSDFGDLDLLILLEHQSPSCGGMAPKKQAVLIEAKVSTDTNSWQTIGNRLDLFMRMIDGGEADTSNLFVQLYRKMRLVEVLSEGESPFLPDLLTPQGRLGANQVVRRACRAMADHVKQGGQAWYGAIVPDAPEDLNGFARALIQNRGVASSLPGWELKRLGFLSWHKVHAQSHADQKGWPRTVSSFAWNEGQIFRDDPSVGHDIQPGGIYHHDRRYVFVVPGQIGNTCRVAHLEDGDPIYFWRTEAVPLAALARCPAPTPAFVQPHLPDVGQRYIWADRNDGCPGLRRPHPPELVDGTTVEIVTPSWLTTRVRRAGDEPKAGSFLVCTHHLERQPAP